MKCTAQMGACALQSQSMSQLAVYIPIRHRMRGAVLSTLPQDHVIFPSDRGRHRAQAPSRAL